MSETTTLPTSTEVRNALASEMVGFLGYEGAEVDETLQIGTDEIEARAVTIDGRTFGFRVRVTEVWETDL